MIASTAAAAAAAAAAEGQSPVRIGMDQRREASLSSLYGVQVAPVTRTTETWLQGLAIAKIARLGPTCD